MPAPDDDGQAGGDTSVGGAHVYSPGRDPGGLYQVLGVSMDATQREISQAYLLRTTPGPACLVVPEQVMTCHRAFQVLGDPVRRKSYDPQWTTHLPTTPDAYVIKQSGQGASLSLRRRIELERGLDEYRLRQASSSPAGQRRVTNSPFGCLGLLGLIAGLILFCS
jgi:hypothetical protein